MAKYILPLAGITEKEFTDKGAEAGREHTYMKVFLKIQLFIRQIEKECQKTGPHIEKIQAVKNTALLARIDSCCKGYDQKSQRKPQGNSIDNLTVFFSILFTPSI